MDALKVLQSSNFDWTVMLQNVWTQADSNVVQLNGKILGEFRRVIEVLHYTPNQSSPPAWVVSGKAGVGKTHTLRQFRSVCREKNALFVLVDMTDVRDFWDTTLLGYFTSLQQLVSEAKPQYELVIENLFSQFVPKDRTGELLDVFKRRALAELKADCHRILKHLAQRFSMQVNLYGDTIRALLALNSSDYNISNVGATWLQGESITTEQRALLGMVKERESNRRIVEGLAWLMSFSGPTVVAYDQLDPIINQFQINATNNDENSDDARLARIIMNGLGAGFSALRDSTANFRTLIVLSCVEMSWETLKEGTLRSYIDRFDEPRILAEVGDTDRVSYLIQSRLGPSFHSNGFTPPYATWPFPLEVIQTWVSDTPREILKRCHRHISECLRAGKVSEFKVKKDEIDSSLRIGAIEMPETTSVQSLDQSSKFGHFDREFKLLQSKVDFVSIIDEENEDGLFAELIEEALQCALIEADLPESVDGFVDTSFSGGSSNKPLHARLRLVFNEEDGREDHVCFRVIQRSNATALQHRLKSAVTQSGIDRALPFRHLYIIRSIPMPSGKVTRELVQRFSAHGGVQLIPKEEDIRSLRALSVMRQRNETGLESWIKARRYVSCRSFLSEALPDSLIAGCPGDGETLTNKVDEQSISEQIDVLESLLGSGAATLPPSSKSENTIAFQSELKQLHIEDRKVPAKVLSASTILLGHRLIGKTEGDSIGIDVGSLDKHGVVFGGAGSGKTVLLKRLIEEAALARIPSIVLDCANDLCSLGIIPPNGNRGCRLGDAEKSVRLQSETETILWTPMLMTGNPIGLAPLPDLASLVDDEDELNDAISMSEEALSETIVKGSASVKQLKSAVLTQALRYLARNGGCNLEVLGELLSDLPAEFSTKISDGRKLAKQMADSLHASMISNRMLLPGQPILDPRVLLGDDRVRSKTRISVINFAGLSTQEMQRQFINQLAMTLFAWIKKNPNPADRPLRGLLIIDEARDFIPSGGSSACMGSIRRLAAQARKYKLGVIFATQNPKDIDSKIIGQCSTQWFGKMNSPVAINTANELLRDRGFPGADTASLGNGLFIVSNNDEMRTPMKIKTNMCLSEHGTPWELTQVLDRARTTSKVNLGG